jgi:hypothetical protein
MLKKTTCVVLIWIIVANVLLFAQGSPIPPGRWNKVQKEKSGTGIIVTLQGGEMLTCSLKSISQDTIIVTTENAKEREIPKIAVRKIITEGKRSGPLWNGGIIGAAIPIAICAIASAGYSGSDKGKDTATCIAVGGAIGAAIGIGLDAAVRNQNTLYMAPNSEK